MAPETSVKLSLASEIGLVDLVHETCQKMAELLPSDLKATVARALRFMGAELGTTPAGERRPVAALVTAR